MVETQSAHQVRSWYGLRGEITIRDDGWHWVKAGPLPLPHPALINLLIRRGLPRPARRRLSILHELGHFETLPVALVHLALMLRDLSRSRQIRRRPWAGRVIVTAITHQAFWELASEGYVVLRARGEYLRLYRTHPSRLLALFWIGATGVALLDTVLGRR